MNIHLLGARNIYLWIIKNSHPVLYTKILSRKFFSALGCINKKNRWIQSGESGSRSGFLMVWFSRGSDPDPLHPDPQPCLSVPGWTTLNLALYFWFLFIWQFWAKFYSFWEKFCRRRNWRLQRRNNNFFFLTVLYKSCHLKSLYLDYLNTTFINVI